MNYELSAALLLLQSDIVGIEEDKGWRPNNNTFPESLCLIHSEVSEALEAFREIGFDKRTREDGKPDDVASELADVLIRVLSTWAQFLTPNGYDCGSEVLKKMAYNESREFRHGGKRL